MDKILEKMSKGEKNRDATTKIRGFIFQDYYTIELLLDEEISEIYTEYIEDIIYKKNSKYHCVQSKYTEGDASSNITDGIKSLYYQYLKAGFLKKKDWELILLSTNIFKIDKSVLEVNDNCSGHIDIDGLDDIKKFLNDTSNIKPIDLRNKYVIENLSTTQTRNDFNIEIIKRPLNHTKSSGTKLKSYQEELLEKIKQHFKTKFDDKTLFGLCLCYVHNNCYLRGSKTSVSNSGLSEFINKCDKKQSDEEIILSCIKIAYKEMLDIYFEKSEDSQDLNTIHDELYKYFNDNIRDEKFGKAFKRNFHLREDDVDSILHAYDTIVEYFKKLHKFFISCIKNNIISIDELIFENLFDVEKEVLTLSTRADRLQSIFLSTPNSSDEMKFTKNVCKHLTENKLYLPIWYYQDSDKNRHYAYYNLDFSGVRDDTMSRTMDITDPKSNRAFFVHCLDCCSTQEHKLCNHSEFQCEMFENKCKGDK